MKETIGNLNVKDFSKFLENGAVILLNDSDVPIKVYFENDFKIIPNLWEIIEKQNNVLLVDALKEYEKNKGNPSWDTLMYSIKELCEIKEQRDRIITINIADAYKDVRESDFNEVEEEVLTEYEKVFENKDYWVEFKEGDFDCWDIKTLMKYVPETDIDILAKHLPVKDIEAIKINYNIVSEEALVSILNAENLPSFGTQYLEDELDKLMKDVKNGLTDNKRLNTIDALIKGGVFVSKDFLEKFDDFLNNTQSSIQIKELRKNITSDTPLLGIMEAYKNSLPDVRFAIKDLKEGEIVAFYDTLEEVLSDRKSLKENNPNNDTSIIFVNKEDKELNVNFSKYLLEEMNKNLKEEKAFIVDSKTEKQEFVTKENKESLYKIYLYSEVNENPYFNIRLSNEEINKQFGSLEDAVIDFYETSYKRLINEDSSKVKHTQKAR